MWTLPSPAVPKSTCFPTASLNIFIVFSLCHFVEPRVISLWLYSVFPWLLIRWGLFSCLSICIFALWIAWSHTIFLLRVLRSFPATCSSKQGGKWQNDKGERETGRESWPSSTRTRNGRNSTTKILPLFAPQNSLQIWIWNPGYLFPSNWHIILLVKFQPISYIWEHVQTYFQS